MITVPLTLHDTWFYWAHRLEHRVPLLWEFHKIHHSDENMNASTYERDHFLQTAFRGFFSVFTLGLIFDLDLREAGQAAFYSSVVLSVWSMFYHSERWRRHSRQEKNNYEARLQSRRIGSGVTYLHLVWATLFRRKARTVLTLHNILCGLPRNVSK